MLVSVGVLIGIGFVLVFGAVGVGLLVKYFIDKKKTDESQAWSATTGTITEAYVHESASQDTDGYTTTTYYPEVRYAYQVIGTEYAGKRISFGGNVGGNRKRAEEMVALYPVGKSVPVYYDPNNYEEAVLERRMGSKVLLIVGIVFTLTSVCSACIGSIAFLINAANT